MDSWHPHAAGTVASVTTICTPIHTAENSRKEKSKLSPRGTEEFLGCWVTWGGFLTGESLLSQLLQTWVFLADLPLNHSCHSSLAEEQDLDKHKWHFSAICFVWGSNWSLRLKCLMLIMSWLMQNFTASCNLAPTQSIICKSCILRENKGNVGKKPHY